jgi:hypothetical protein
MKENNADLPWCRQRREHESQSVCDMNRVQGDDNGTDERRWRVGNVLVSLAQAEQVRTKRVMYLLERKFSSL